MYCKYNTHFQHWFDVLDLQTCQINIDYSNVGSFYHDLTPISMKDGSINQAKLHPI